MRYFYSLVITLLGLGKLAQAGYTFPDTSCDANKQALLNTELANVVSMATASQVDPQAGGYYDTFFYVGDETDPTTMASQVAGSFENIKFMATATDHDYDFTIKCNNATNTCGKGFFAHMNNASAEMNFCDLFFTLQTTEQAMAQCSDMDLRVAQRSMSAVILHETTHVSYTIGKPRGSQVFCLDYVYGFNGCYKLSMGDFNRNGYPQRNPDHILCPGDPVTEEGPCPEETANINADSWSHVAAGIWFSQECGRAIPQPMPPAKRAADIYENHPKNLLGARYIVVDDGIIWDSGEDDAEAD